MTFLLISIFLLILYSVLLLYYRQGWREIPTYVPKEFDEIEFPFISIIIAARNEENNIGGCIHSILNQTYPATNFEIIVTDDHSTDNTVSIIKSFQKENITVLHLADFIENQQLNSYKKNQSILHSNSQKES